MQSKANRKMPAARPSQGSISNALKALVIEGLQPSAIHVAADGGFRVEIAVAARSTDAAEPAERSLRWEDLE